MITTADGDDGVCKGENKGGLFKHAMMSPRIEKKMTM